MLCVALKAAALVGMVPLPLPTPEALENLHTQIRYVEYVMNQFKATLQGAADQPLAPTAVTMRASSRLGRPKLAGQPYKSMRDLLWRMENPRSPDQHAPSNWTPSKTGLERVVSRRDGHVAWVHPSVVDRFHTEGAAALRAKGSV